MSEIEIKTPDDVMGLIFKITQMEMQYPGFVSEKSKEIAEEYLVKRIQEEMKKKGYSEKIIEKVRAEFVSIDSDGFVEFDIISDFKADGFEVAEMVEKGRKRYFVEPVLRFALSWVKEGFRYFSRGHWIPMRKGDHIFDTVLETEINNAQERLDSELEDFIEKRLS